MASKVTCTCGWSWNKSDSSKKDMYVCHQCGKDNTMKNGGWLSKFDVPEAENGIEGTMGGLTDIGFNYNGAWGGPSMQIGGSIPGSVGFSYARTQSPAPSKGKYAKKTMASAQNGQEMKFYQEGLDWKPKTISQDGTVVPNWASDLGTRLSNAVSTFGGSAIGDAVKGISPRAADWLNENSMGFIPYTTDEELMATRAGNPSRGMNTAVQVSDAVSSVLLNKMIGPLSGKANTAIKKGTNKVVKGATDFAQDFNKGYRSIPTREDGGIIEDDLGQWAHPGEITKINSNQITMQGVDYPVLGISDTGDTQMMQPGQDYTYEGESVTEIPMMQKGGEVISEERPTIRNIVDKSISSATSLVGDLIAPLTPEYESVKDREDLFKRYRPVEYPGFFNSLRGALYPEEQGSPRRDSSGSLDIGEEAWRKALDLPVKEKYIIPSKYKPTKANDPKAKYYTLKDIIDPDKLITEAKKLGWKPGTKYNMESLAPFIKDGSVTDQEDFGNIDPLQKFQLNIDPEGNYVSIYDKYDFNFAPANKAIKPYEFYDRFYLPEKKVSRGKKENGGWLSKYN